jgi:hypothetical protein
MMPEENDLLQQQIVLITGGTLVAENSMECFREKLAAYIHTLINNDFEKLISILYRLDINEKNLKALLAEKPGEDAGVLIAAAVIERQLQKITSRKKNSGSGNDIPEEEKW